MKQDNRLPVALFSLRVGVFIVMLMWTLDKFVRPEHASKVFQNFYFAGGLDNIIFYIFGAIEVALLVGFLLGFKKRVTYGAVFLLHAVSTLSSFKQYLAPFENVNLLFFAAWPMLAACFALYLLRDLDTLWAIDKE